MPRESSTRDPGGSSTPRMECFSSSSRRTRPMPTTWSTTCAGRGLSTRRDMAADLGLWEEDESASLFGMRDSASLAYDGLGEGAAHFRVDRTPSIGAENNEPENQSFRRGDCNDDSSADISDAIRLFGFLFLGERGPCARTPATGTTMVSSTSRMPSPSSTGYSAAVGHCRRQGRGLRS